MLTFGCFSGTGCLKLTQGDSWIVFDTHTLAHTSVPFLAQISEPQGNEGYKINSSFATYCFALSL